MVNFEAELRVTKRGLIHCLLFLSVSLSSLLSGYSLVKTALKLALSFVLPQSFAAIQRLFEWFEAEVGLAEEVAPGRLTPL